MSNNERFLVKYEVSRSGKEFIPVPNRKYAKTLPAGYYTFEDSQEGIYLSQASYSTLDILKFPDTILDTIINEFNVFWTYKESYQERKEPHKRGYLLYGPPGGGKSSLVSLLLNEFIADGNIVFNFSSHTLYGLNYFREIEPDRKTMIVIEDIDIYIGTSTEEHLLQFLDGNLQQVNTVVIATTNYPEKLPARIRNRPSRFDRTEKIGYPSVPARKLYIEAKSKTMSTEEKETLVKDTEGFTLAHIKEIILSVEVYRLDYNTVLDRISEMAKMNSTSDKDYHSNQPQMGFEHACVPEPMKKGFER